MTRMARQDFDCLLQTWDGMNMEVTRLVGYLTTVAIPYRFKDM